MPHANPPELDELQPMLLTQRRALPWSGDWIYEVKQDGIRILAGTDPVRLKTKGGSDAMTWFPEVVQILASLPAQTILDGEVVVQDDIGRSDFDRLMTRARRRRWYAGADLVVYGVFDLLVLRGKDMRSEPLEKRKAALRKLVTGINVLYVDSVDDGQWLYDQVLKLELEGVVGKRLGSTYQAGIRSSDWIKVKRPGAVPARRFSRSST